MWFLCTMRRMRPDRVRTFRSTFPLLLSIVTLYKHYINGKAKDRTRHLRIENGTFYFENLEKINLELLLNKLCGHDFLNLEKYVKNHLNKLETSRKLHKIFNRLQQNCTYYDILKIELKLHDIVPANYR